MARGGVFDAGARSALSLMAGSTSGGWLFFVGRCRFVGVGGGIWSGVGRSEFVLRVVQTLLALAILWGGRGFFIFWVISYHFAAFLLAVSEAGVGDGGGISVL